MNIDDIISQEIKEAVDTLFADMEQGELEELPLLDHEQERSLHESYTQTDDD